ncbi:MAG TPA: DMT family transporter [Dongiaceae bacterium]|nr:DMT family transporter [Dongiaceae bacterium]
MPPKTEFGRHSLGIGLYLTGVFFFAVNDALGKWLVASYGVGEMLFIRSVGGVIMLVPLALYVGASLRIGGDWRLQLLRILAQTADSYCFYYSTRFLPLADVMTFYMAAPIIVTAISALALGERVGPYRWSAVIVGFIGVVIALAPSGEAFHPAALIALTGATCFAVSLAMTRKLRNDNPFALVTSQYIGSGAIGAVLSPLEWATPGATDLGLLLLLGIVSAGCFILITKAVALAPASLLAPFQYSAILWAAIFGWIVWMDVPTPRIILGNAILIASGLFVFYRERRLSISVSDRVEPIP